MTTSCRPPGAEGLNLALHDVRALAEALADWYRSGNTGGLDAYSDTCLRRVWRAEHFSWWMTQMHRSDVADVFELKLKLKLSQLRYVTSSQAAAASLAETFVRLEVV